MDCFEYLAAFTVTIERNYPNTEKRKIEDYLDTFAALPPLLQETRKCAVIAQQYRSKGNILYRIGNYEDAVLIYTYSLKNAPPYSECAAMAYANRSQALYQLKAYGDCVLDVDKALGLPYPENVRLCLNSLKESALGNLNHIASAQAIVDLKYAHGENAELQGFSRGINIAHNSQNGRKLVAKMPFKAGDVLIVQNPYLPVIELEEDPAYCHHCLKKAFSLIPCDLCSYEVYCSEECRTEAYEKYHRIECRIQTTLITAFPLNREGLLCQLRCLNILTEQGTNLDAVYDDLKEIEENSDPPNDEVARQNFYGNPRKVFLSLLSGKRTKHVLEEMKCNSGAMFEATYIVTLLRNHTDFFQKNSDIPLVAKMLIKLSTAYAINHFAIPYFGKTDIKARVIYPLASLANHACVNNTITYIDGDGRIVLRALQSIRPGEEILCSYYIHFQFEETVNRSGRILQCKRHCKQCDKIFSYPPEKRQHVKLDQRLRAKLQKNPYNIKGLWKLLSLMRGKHQRYTLQALIVKSMLVDAYEGRCDYAIGTTQFHILGIM